ncbi:MAG TPA: hypothetical protein VHW60_00080 [Caulobacteraceae bacterium]|jgi:hypothetical protein|nr:hypothetical protein [Caulobacteraceae bacterium]
MSLIERTVVERRFIDGTEREVLVVWAFANCGSERMKELSEEASALMKDRFCRVELHIPPALPPAPRS